MAKILIIGAGLGGLVLAQILLANNVPFEIFERDESTSSRNQGWAVALVEYVRATSLQCHKSEFLISFSGVFLASSNSCPNSSAQTYTPTA